MTIKEFEDKLKLRCPNTFSLLHEVREDGHLLEPIQFGIEIKEGWWEILAKCAIKLECLNSGTEVVQVKEKFGELCIYVDKGSEQIYKVISEAEEEASRTCEYCGKPGKLRTVGWWKTLCVECNKCPVITDPNQDEDLII